MEAKASSSSSSSDPSGRAPAKQAQDDDDLEENYGVPSPQVIALRQGYNQTYIIRASKTNLHEVLFRCGNWCYSGKVDLGNSALELCDLPVVIPALQKQQGSLQYLCEWKAMPSSSTYTVPLETLYDAFDFIGAELASKRIENKLLHAAEEYSWIDEESEFKNFFELQSGGYDCFDDIDMVASKTFVRGLVLLIIYYQRSFFIVLQEGDGEQPLLDVRFPDLSAHLQGIHLQTYREDDGTNMKKLTLWQAVKNPKHLSPVKPVKVQCKDVSGAGYNQTFLIRKHKGSGTVSGAAGDGAGGASAGNNLREVLFRFGNWCYNGHVDLGPRLELPDIPIIIPMLRRQQSALTFMCEVSKMPATSLFTNSMEHLANAIPSIQQELTKAENFVQALGRSQKDGEFASKMAQWLEDDQVECFFEVSIDKCDALKDVEAIASKIYLGQVVMVLVYFDQTFYVYLESGEEEMPLLDTNFPDVSFQKEGMQIQTYRDGVDGCPELRRISLWKVINDFQDELDQDGQEEQEEELEAKSRDVPKALHSATRIAPAKNRSGGDALSPTAKSCESRRVQDTKDVDEEDSPNPKRASLDSMSRHPHHIAPLASKLKKIPDDGLKAPWDETGRPLGLRK